MAVESCQHEWSMVNVRNGYLVTEGCAHCGGRLSYFSAEQTPPVDSYTEGDHIWKHLGSSQAVKFDLECTKCGKLVKLDSMVGMMLCTNCTTDCNAGALGTLLGREHTWIYVALCSNSTHENGKCVGLEETRTLTEYFNSRIKTAGKRVFFVPCRFVSNMDICRGEIIADIGLTDVY